jgi:hypothetical protein
VRGTELENLQKEKEKKKKYKFIEGGNSISLTNGWRP